MADPSNVLEFDPRLNAQGIPPATPLQGFTAGIPELRQAGEERQAGLLASAGRQRTELADVRRMGAEQQTAAAAARPTPETISPPPSLAPRPFLAPGEGMLSQIQAAILGATQMVLGVGGLKGRGHAIAAVAGLKGALEGWAAGDHERANAALTEWEKASKALLENHRMRREAYQDLITDQKRDMQLRLAEIGIQASIDGQEDLARAAKEGNVGQVLQILGQREQQERQHEDRMMVLKNSIAQHQENARRLDRQHADLQVQRGIANKRLEEGLNLRKQNQQSLIKLEKEDDSIGSNLRNMDALEESVKRAYAKGVIPKGPTLADKAAAKLALQTKFGDEELANDIQTIQRLGTALLVGSEVASGLAPTVARLKVVGEAEAAGADAIPKAFWDKWFDRQRQSYLDRRKTLRSHLKARTATPGTETEPEPEGGGEDPLGIK